MKGMLVLFLIMFVFEGVLFGQDEGNNRVSKLLLGVSGVYANYPSLENQIGLSIDNNKFLVGFNVGIVVNNVLFDFIYAYKVYPINDNSFREYRVIDSFSVYNFDFGYLFTILENYLYVAPVVSVSVDGFVLKFYKNVNMNEFSSIEVKDMDSRTLSLGVGLRIAAFRNIFVSGYYFYSFPNIYYYQGVSVENSPIFRPQGLRSIVSLTF